MNQLFAERFKSARLMKGYSLQDLSDNLGVNISRQALHKYEKGEVLPDSEMMEHLCIAFGVRPDFFTNDTIVELGKIEFRKLGKFPSKEQNSVIERTKEKLMRYLEIEELLGINEPFDNPLKNKPAISSFDEVEAYAKLIRDKWDIGLNPIPNVPELLEEKNVKVIELNAGDGFDGLQTWVNNDQVPVIVLNTNKKIPDDRKRFNALHELGHLILPLDGIEEKLTEKYCHRFASAMLLPQKSAIDEFGSKRKKISIRELAFVKQQYGISIQAIIYRLCDLNIITNSYLRYYFRYFNEMGWRKDEPFEYKGIESSDRFIQLTLRALFEDIISISKAASLQNMKVPEFKQQYLYMG